MTHADKIAQWIGEGKIGAAIGPGGEPISGVSPPPIRIGTGREAGAGAGGTDYDGDPCSLPFHDNCLDYVAGAHVLERVANPVAALAEWYRVLRPGGVVYLAVADRLATADHTRALTSVDHILDDYARGATACDASHIDEFVYEMDWSRYAPGMPVSDVPGARASLARGMHEAVARGEEIDMPFHTFEPASLRELVERLRRWPARRFNWEIVDQVDRFPDAEASVILTVIRVEKRWLDRAEAGAFDVTAGADRRAAVVRSSAAPPTGRVRTRSGLGART